MSTLETTVAGLNRLMFAGQVALGRLAEMVTRAWLQRAAPLTAAQLQQEAFVGPPAKPYVFRGLTALDRERFSWGSVNLVDAGATRAAYVAALRTADNHDYAPLLAFVRS